MGSGSFFPGAVPARCAQPISAGQTLDQNTDTGMYDIYGRSYTLAFSLTY